MYFEIETFLVDSTYNVSAATNHKAFSDSTKKKLSVV